MLAVTLSKIFFSWSWGKVRVVAVVEWQKDRRVQDFEKREREAKVRSTQLPQREMPEEDRNGWDARGPTAPISITLSPSGGMR